MKKKLIVANWKMSPDTLTEAREIFNTIRRTAKDLSHVETLVCPPFVFLSELSKLVRSSRYGIGAQDVFWEDAGAYTGEVSPVHLERLDVRSVILGHSERRALGENDKIVNKKVKACFKNGVQVILCVGEKERDPHGNYLRFVKDQLKSSLFKVSKKDIGKLAVAYEPVWAISSTRLTTSSSHHQGADTPENVLEMSIFIRKILSDIYDKKVAMATPVLYGGSVTDENAERFLREGGARGFLVGRASLDALKFTTILKIAEKVRN